MTLKCRNWKDYKVSSGKEYVKVCEGIGKDVGKDAFCAIDKRTRGGYGLNCSVGGSGGKRLGISVSRLTLPHAKKLGDQVLTRVHKIYDEFRMPLL